MTKKGKNIEALFLPEAMIHHIQSFMTEKEAVGSSLLSKSWYNAWLTRPTLHIDIGDSVSDSDSDSDSDFDSVPKEFTAKTMQRYRDMRLNLESFRLRVRSRNSYTTLLSHQHLLNAMKIGATNVELEFPTLTLPPQVLGSKTLLGLSMTTGCVDDASTVVSCSRLKSLKLKGVDFISDDVFKDIISCCVSMEELSLSRCPPLVLSFTNLYELRKLRRLSMDFVDVDTKFFTGFASRFPCLKDLSILGSCSYPSIQIASTSLETVRFEPMHESECATFEVPNIRRFTYKGRGLISIEGASREWKLDLSLYWCVVDKSPSWCQNLKDLLTKFRLSRISLHLYVNLPCGFELDEVGIEAPPKPLVIENLKIEALILKPLVLDNLKCEPFISKSCSALVHLFGICRPKFITQGRLAHRCYVNTSFDDLYKRLMQRLIFPNCGIPDQDMIDKFGLKRVNMEVYEKLDFEGEEWRPLVLKAPLDVMNPPRYRQKVRFELVWDDSLY